MEPITGRPVRIGVIGCGQIAQKHFENYTNIAGVEVVACTDNNPDAAAKSAAKWNVPHVYNDVQEMLRRDDLDAVDVCLHNNLHASATIAALEAGCSVYCEKPIAGTYHDGVVMRDRARETGKYLHIQLDMLFARETRAAKALIDDGKLGEIYHGRSLGHRRRGRPYIDGYGKPDFVQKDRSGGGALFDMGVYHISQLLYLMGNPDVRRISGQTYQKIPMDPTRAERSGANVEELAMGFVRFAGGITLDIIEAWAIHLDKFEGSYVVGTDGGVRLDPFGFFRSEGDLDIDGGASMGAFVYRQRKLRSDDNDTDHYASPQAHWVAALAGRVPLLPTADVALNTMLVSEGIYLSAQEEREVTVEEVRERSVSKMIAL